MHVNGGAVAGRIRPGVVPHFRAAPGADLGALLPKAL